VKRFTMIGTLRNIDDEAKVFKVYNDFSFGSKDRPIISALCAQLYDINVVCACVCLYMCMCICVCMYMYVYVYVCLDSYP